jgi:uncharacterized protein (DUF3084 family)
MVRNAGATPDRSASDLSVIENRHAGGQKQMTMGTMGGASQGVTSDRLLALAELLSDPVKLKAKLDVFNQREQSARLAEADHKKAAQAAQEATTHARQTADALNQRTADVARREDDVTRREDLLRGREISVERAERELQQERARLEADLKQRNDDLAKRVNEWAAMLSRLG